MLLGFGETFHLLLGFGMEFVEISTYFLPLFDSELPKVFVETLSRKLKGAMGRRRVRLGSLRRWEGYLIILGKALVLSITLMTTGSRCT